MVSKRGVDLEVIRKIYNFLYFIIFLINFKIYALTSIPKGSKVIIFDIDNTIAATRESINKNDFLSLEPIQNLCDISGRFNNSNEFTVLYMSARPLRGAFKTKKWLSHHVKSVKTKKLFLVRTPMQKVISIQKILANRRKLLIDDMSFNFDDEIHFFTSALDKIDIDLEHLGLDFIIESQNMSEEKLHQTIIAKFNN